MNGVRRDIVKIGGEAALVRDFKPGENIVLN